MAVQQIRVVLNLKQLKDHYVARAALAHGCVYLKDAYTHLAFEIRLRTDDADVRRLIVFFDQPKRTEWIETVSFKYRLCVINMAGNRVKPHQTPFEHWTYPNVNYLSGQTYGMWLSSLATYDYYTEQRPEGVPFVLEIADIKTTINIGAVIGKLLCNAPVADTVCQDKKLAELHAVIEQQQATIDQLQATLDSKTVAPTSPRVDDFLRRKLDCIDCDDDTKMTEFESALIDTLRNVSSRKATHEVTLCKICMASHVSYKYDACPHLLCASCILKDELRHKCSTCRTDNPTGNFTRIVV